MKLPSVFHRLSGSYSPWSDTHSLHRTAVWQFAKRLCFGMLNDICVALQYLLTSPSALALYQILLSYNPTLMRAATIVGIGSMLLTLGLQLLLIFKVLTFEQQVLWVSLAMILGVGSWLVATRLLARSTGRLPNSLLMSSVAVPYIGYPVWAFWIGLQLLSW